MKQTKITRKWTNRRKASQCKKVVTELRRPRQLQEENHPGITEAVLLRAAGWAQGQVGTRKPEYDVGYGRSPFGDDPNDQYWIKAGIEYAKRSGF